MSCLTSNDGVNRWPELLSLDAIFCNGTDFVESINIKLSFITVQVVDGINGKLVVPKRIQSQQQLFSC